MRRIFVTFLALIWSFLIHNAPAEYLKPSSRIIMDKCFHDLNSYNCSTDFFKAETTELNKWCCIKIVDLGDEDDLFEGNFTTPLISHEIVPTITNQIATIEPEIIPGNDVDANAGIDANEIEFSENYLGATLPSILESIIENSTTIIHSTEDNWQSEGDEKNATMEISNNSTSTTDEFISTKETTTTTTTMTAGMITEAAENDIAAKTLHDIEFTLKSETSSATKRMTTTTRGIKRPKSIITSKHKNSKKISQSNKNLPSKTFQKKLPSRGPQKTSSKKLRTGAPFGSKIVTTLAYDDNGIWSATHRPSTLNIFTPLPTLHTNNEKRVTSSSSKAKMPRRGGNEGMQLNEEDFSNGHVADVKQTSELPYENSENFTHDIHGNDVKSITDAGENRNSPKMNSTDRKDDSGKPPGNEHTNEGSSNEIPNGNQITTSKITKINSTFAEKDENKSHRIIPQTIEETETPTSNNESLSEEIDTQDKVRNEKEDAMKPDSNLDDSKFIKNLKHVGVSENLGNKMESNEISDPDESKSPQSNVNKTNGKMKYSENQNDSPINNVSDGNGNVIKYDAQNMNLVQDNSENGKISEAQEGGRINSIRGSKNYDEKHNLNEYINNKSNETFQGDELKGMNIRDDSISENQNKLEEKITTSSSNKIDNLDNDYIEVAPNKNGIKKGKPESSQIENETNVSKQEPLQDSRKKSNSPSKESSSNSNYDNDDNNHILSTKQDDNQKSKKKDLSTDSMNSIEYSKKNDKTLQKDEDENDSSNIPLLDTSNNLQTNNKVNKGNIFSKDENSDTDDSNSIDSSENKVIKNSKRKEIAADPEASKIVNRIPKKPPISSQKIGSREKNSRNSNHNLISVHDKDEDDQDNFMKVQTKNKVIGIL